MDANAVIRNLFDHALQLPEADREAYLDSAAPDEDVRAVVRELLLHSERAGNFLDHPAGVALDSPGALVGKLIAEFVIEDCLGYGGMGVVYLARDTRLERLVALKVLAPHMVGSVQAIDRLRREAQTAATLDHPGIVPVYRYDQDAGLHFIAMKYVPGTTLHAVLGALTDSSGGMAGSGVNSQVKLGAFGSPEYIRQIVQVLASVAEALQHAHARGVIHRDIKPSNIILDTSINAHLTDFGIAKFIDDTAVTSPSQTPGTIQYMSPERVGAVKVDHRTDLFSLGVVLYEALSGRLPFKGDSPKDIIQAICNDHPPRLTGRIARFQHLDLICAKALEKDPKNRYASAGELAADLRRWLRNEQPLARRPLVVVRIQRWARCHRVSLGIAGAVLVVGMFVAMLLLYREASSAQLIELRVVTPGRDSEVSVRLMDPTTLLPGTKLDLGKSPASRRLPRGQYRIEVTGRGGRVSQTSVVLLHPGQTSIVELPPTGTAPLQPDEMVFIPGGTFMFHGVNGDTLQSIPIADFYIDSAEVSNAQYADFIKDTGRDPPPHWLPSKTYSPALADRPIVGVTWEDAQAFARWRGKRLPTLHEWEYAMRQPDNRTLPWGSAPMPFVPPDRQTQRAFAEPKLNALYAEYVRGTVGVRFDPEGRATPLGIFHAASNVREYCENVMVGNTTQVILKGASWVDDPQVRDLTDIMTNPFEAVDENGQPILTRSMKLGFRCVRPAPPPSKESHS